MSWDPERIPDQSGRVAVVTGANSGLGLVTARELAHAGARVVLACRNLEKGRAALEEIRSAVPGAELELEELDLASLDSVRGLAERFRAAHDGLDWLINNAGVMATPRRRT
ncbi:MAG TPA: SDR family NAD(P)-dependent oxidoreductase, partial [Thermoleophilaceae bacterium]|nr:SDR family NAD(P)-dependent oxidoreductase [Thermoleophilaceae bacterium]